MKKVINIFLVLLILTAIIILGVIIYRYSQYHKNSEEAVEVVAQIEEQFAKTADPSTGEVQKVETEYKGYKVVGIIEIPKINIKYPILNKTNDDSMQYSITKFAGGDVNSIGNFVVAGHNYLDGSMFGRVKQLEIGDEIKLTDLYNNTITYEIFDIYSVDPNDTSILESVEENTREVTLITCTKGHVERLITKAREKVNEE